MVVGDRVNVVSPLGRRAGPVRAHPQEPGLPGGGHLLLGNVRVRLEVRLHPPERRRAFFGIKGATGIELKVEDVDDARRIAATVLNTLEGYPYRTKDWGEMNRNLFSALRLEKLVMGIILSIIVIVAAGLIVATVIMLVLEKRKEISVLKALGVSGRRDREDLPRRGAADRRGRGTARASSPASPGASSSRRWASSSTRRSITSPSLPVKIEPLQTALAVVIAILVTYLASIYPALQGLAAWSRWKG